jgi:hypothetical protein
MEGAGDSARSSVLHGDHVVADAGVEGLEFEVKHSGVAV